jgi:hypothetical protein
MIHKKLENSEFININVYMGKVFFCNYVVKMCMFE